MLMNNQPFCPYGIPSTEYAAYETPTDPSPIVPARAATLGPAVALYVAPVINAAIAGPAGCTGPV
eukprot:scaffold1569_cov160-Chaetoceros_neogracile.AAC.3